MKKTVFITGASSGIGRATAFYFAAKGWQVAATMRNPEHGQDLVKLPNIKVFRLDVQNTIEIQAAIRDTIASFGKIDVLVNNAGFAVVGPFEVAAMNDIHQQFETNVFGLMNVTREILPYFREQKSGIVVNLSSIAGRMTFPLYSLYHASKYAVEGFSESLQYELRPFGIKVKLIEPGPIKTDFYDRSMNVLSARVSKEYKDYFEKGFKNLQNFAVKAPKADKVAQVIYRAASDGTNRLRYPADKAARLLILASKLLPKRLFFAFVRKVVE